MPILTPAIPMPTPRPVPTIAALYGAAVDIRRLLKAMGHQRPLLYVSLCIAADEAAHAMLGTKRKEAMCQRARPECGAVAPRQKAQWASQNTVTGISPEAISTSQPGTRTAPSRRT